MLSDACRLDWMEREQVSMTRLWNGDRQEWVFCVGRRDFGYFEAIALRDAIDGAMAKLGEHLSAVHG